jgi:uncharacterized protein YjaZ
MQNMRTLFTLIVVTLFWRCEAGTPQPYFKVILMSDYYTAYYKSAMLDFTNRDKLFIGKIKDPILKNYFTNAEYYDIVKESFIAAPDTVQLTKAIAAIEFNRKEIESIISSTLLKCNQYLKNDSLTFYILPASADAKQIISMMGGVTGSTAGKQQILLTIDPEINSWKEMLAYSVAHEFNHAYWTRVKFTRSYRWTLLRYLVFEGKADSFAHLLYPKARAPWTSSLSESEKTELWNRIKGELNNEDPNLLTEVMFGSQKYPLWGGYTIGYDIVQKAMKNKSELTPDRLAELDADKILQQANYK